MEFYYHSRMGKARQITYHAILTGLEELRPAFPVPRLEMEALGQILFQLRLDHPEIFYVTGFSCRGTGKEGRSSSRPVRMAW